MNIQHSLPVLVMLIVVIDAGRAWAHGGGVDKDGCHTKRSTGEYHCHGGGSASARTRNFGGLASDFSPATTQPSRPMQSTGAFANCTEARAAGAAPIRRRDPGYGTHLDRDNDGVACEPYRERR